MKLKELFCSSRPYDKPVCITNNCKICERLSGGQCMKKGVVYCITCKLCNNKYVGETNISARDRLSEYLRFANNPNCNSYKEEALALHYTEKHSGISADFEFEILCIETSTVNRKILESYCISLIKPQINNKDESISIKQFLIV